MSDAVLPKGWPKPRGYTHGLAAAGRLLAISGQIGSKPPKMEMARGFGAQFAQALANVLAVVEAGGGRADDLVSLTIYVTDQRLYHAATAEVSEVWRKLMGQHYPTMALVEVKGLIDPEAVVEIQGLAVIA